MAVINAPCIIGAPLLRRRRCDLRKLISARCLALVLAASAINGAQPSYTPPQSVRNIYAPKNEARSVIDVPPAGRAPVYDTRREELRSMSR
ncbi:hypothetical protein BD311DRAFT_141235 [Dichomitus squalens]|uniref:Uncharacterized protein n=1 Tax=Dichomitus squalens TaxID=114155 RepID=A0A4Q9M6C9_9APHY|nr:hypothetical protein BD311DRAFT_141235 [Dichomitus squalens]